MLFDSPVFLYVFLPLCLIVFYAFSRFRLLRYCPAVLLFFSVVFYAYWSIKYLAVIFASIAFNYWIAHRIERGKNKKKILAWAIAANLAVLCYFKYFGFFVSSAAHLFSIGISVKHQTLPLGISFYTFTQIAYLVEVYRRKIRPYQLHDYSLFTLFFPHLIAGPIIHYSNIGPQIQSLRRRLVNYSNLFYGIFFFAAGLFQKTIIADFLSPIASQGFAQASALNAGNAWGTVLAFTFQLYFDFSGYSNMALGLALLFNIRFPINFNSPYQASSIIDFWRRWHITLSHFLRDYLYIPLGGNRAGVARTYVNIFITMLLGGLWHGAAWTYVFWGGYHGVLLIGNHLLRKTKIEVSFWPARAATFLLVMYGWVFFKAADFTQALQMTRALAGKNAAPGFAFISNSQSALIALIAGIAFFFPNVLWWKDKIRPSKRWGLVLAGMFVLSFLTLCKTKAPSVFLYWQF